MIDAKEMDEKQLERAVSKSVYAIRADGPPRFSVRYINGQLYWLEHATGQITDECGNLLTPKGGDGE